MKFVIYYHKDIFKSGEILQDVIDQNYGRFERQTFQTFNSLKERFKQACGYNEKEVFILFADSHSRLDQLTSLIDLMEGKCLILILADESRPTLSKAYGLFPRFCTKISSNYDDLCRILNKMISNEQYL